MAPSIGLNLRVTGYKHQGGRRYMEDDFGVAYQQTADEKDLEYAFFGIFDGHGGREAAVFAKEHLMDFIVGQKGFWEPDDESVLKAIHEGFIQTHYAMWKELEKWPKTASGLPSTAGTTASIAFIRRGKIYIGHVGDSAIVLGVQDPDNPDIWRADPLTVDHKPESIEESERIQQCGGKVICKSGVPRVVWNRPRTGHKGPVRRSTHIDEIPFLAVARSLGDLWSYNSEENVFVVSPEPDIHVYPVDISRHRCLVLGTDGAWNMLTPQNAISTVCAAEKANEAHMLNPTEGTAWINPSKQLVDTAIERWNSSKLRADNTSVVTVMLDPPGPPRAQVLKNRKRELAALNAGTDLGNPGLSGARGSMALVTNTTPEDRTPDPARPGFSIISRFPNSAHPAGRDLVQQKREEGEGGPSLPLDFQRATGRLSDSTLVKKSTSSPAPSTSHTTSTRLKAVEDSVQVNEVSSSEDSSPSSRPSSSSTPPPSTSDPAVSTSPLSELNPAAPPSNRKPARKSLSRELSALQLSTPRATRGSARSRTKFENSSDTENLGERSGSRGGRGAGRPPQQKSVSLVKLRCQQINAKIEAAAAVTARTAVAAVSAGARSGRPQPAAVHNLRSADRPETPRALRTRGSPQPSPAAGSALKRKWPPTEAVVAAKSPRTVSIKNPIVTRSRQATVLKLKK